MSSLHSISDHEKSIHFLQKRIQDVESAIGGPNLENLQKDSITESYSDKLTWRFARIQNKLSEITLRNPEMDEFLAHCTL
jgi:hypothetical protein